jgi:hypothetical protein
MAYTAPTLADFRTRYPAFDAVADGTVQVWLDEGDAETVTWPDADRFRAVMLYAAHKLSASGLGQGAVAAGVTSFKSGTFSASVSDAAASRTGFAATPYGRDYLELMRRIFGGARLAWTPPAVIDA